MEKLMGCKRMTWKNILKADLPENNAGQATTNETRQAMDNWAMEYERKLMQSIMKRGDERPDFGYMKFDNQMKQVVFSDNRNTKMSYQDYTNTLKRLVRAVKYGQFKKTNYAFDTEEYLRDTDAYVRDMQGNSTAVNVIFEYIKS
jgi:hypothetical protein